MESMDKLTLELFMNRKRYDKYLDKIDPQKFQETARLNEDLLIYRTRILNAMKEYLYDTSNRYNPEIDELFPTFIRQFIRYFESKDIEAKHENRQKDGKVNEWHMDGPDEEDIPNGYYCEDEDDDTDTLEKEDEEETTIPPKREDIFMTSYWGKSYIKK